MMQIPEVTSAQYIPVAVTFKVCPFELSDQRTVAFGESTFKTKESLTCRIVSFPKEKFYKREFT
jgi:hypothetical protein